MHKFIFLLIGASFLLLAGCLQPKTIQHSMTQTFDASMAQRQMQPGKNTIKGSALLRRLDGNVITCAGTEVNIVPATPYADERMRLLYGNNEQGYNPSNYDGSLLNNIDAVDQGYLALSFKNTCDAQGYFKFENLADGTYYVTTYVRWYSDPHTIQGATLMHRVSVQGGETKDVVLTAN